MFDVNALMRTLAAHRPLFHSEADFQHAFAWELQRCLPDASVRLELPIQVGPKRLHLDIWLAKQGRAVAIELKYPTRKLSTDVNGEAFHLAYGVADLSLYDYIKDIIQLEQITHLNSSAVAYAIMLTNDGVHWTASPETNSATFRLHEGRQLAGTVNWSEKTNMASLKGWEHPLTLTGSYPIHWHDYSHIDATASGTFRYLVVRVPADGR